MKIFVAIVLAASAAFVWWSSGRLPAEVASHFGISGQADAFMSRTAFTLVMLAGVTGVPCLTWVFQLWAARNGKSNIRNKEHWFSAQHYAGTVRFLENHASWFTVGLVAFMSVVHWLVVQANSASDGLAKLDNALFLTALALFAVFVVSSVLVLYARFRRST